MTRKQVFNSIYALNVKSCEIHSESSSGPQTLQFIVHLTETKTAGEDKHTQLQLGSSRTFTQCDAGLWNADMWSTESSAEGKKNSSNLC